MSGFQTDKNKAKAERKKKFPLGPLERKISSNAKSLKRLRREIEYHPSDKTATGKEKRKLYKQLKRTSA